MRINGFTLLELLICLAVFSIVVSMAVPSFKETVKNNQLRSTVNNVYTLIRFARAEAVRKSDTVHVGAFDNKDWASGAVVWLDRDGNDQFDKDHANCKKADQDCELRRTIQKNPISVIEKTKVIFLRFNGKGYASENFTLSFCDGRPKETGKQINVLSSGFSVVSLKYDC